MKKDDKKPVPSKPVDEDQRKMDEVLRRMLNTPPKPEKKKKEKGD